MARQASPCHTPSLQSVMDHSLACQSAQCKHTHANVPASWIMGFVKEDLLGRLHNSVPLSAVSVAHLL